MPYRKHQFVKGEIYHIILRAIDDTIIFKDDNDYYRGIFSIYEFNNANPVTIQLRRKQRMSFKKSLKELVSRGKLVRARASDYSASVIEEIDKKDKLVKV